MTILTIDYLADAIERTFRKSDRAISRHLAELEGTRTTGVGSLIAKPLNVLIDREGIRIKGERPLDEIGAVSFNEERAGGRLDAVFYNADEPYSAAEYKAARMPRRRGDDMYDIGQILENYLRLKHATKIDSAYIAIFVWGPLVRDTPSSGSLWKDFHNQAFLEVQSAIQREHIHLSREYRDAAYELGWLAPCASARVPPRGRAIKVVDRDFGALVIDCKRV